MPKKKSNALFNKIAPVYSLFYNYQKKNFNEILEKVRDILDISTIKSVLDVGCGTGALCFLLKEKGIESVTGIDSAENMIKIAK